MILNKKSNIDIDTDRHLDEKIFFSRNTLFWPQIWKVKLVKRNSMLIWN